MKILLLILHIGNGEVAKIPMTLLSSQSCNDKFVETFKPKASDDGVYYQGKRVWAHYCKDGLGKLIP